MFVTFSHFPSSLLFAGKAGTYSGVTGLHFKGRLLALQENIRLLWQGLSVTNTLAYDGMDLSMAVKMF